MSTVRTIALLVALGVSGCARASSDDGAAPAPSATLPIERGDYPAYGHAADFSWIAGRLTRSAPAGDCTYIIFSTRPGEPWGGRIALDGASASGAAARFPNGDMVVVRGALDTRSPSACGQPTMAAEQVEEH